MALVAGFAANRDAALVNQTDARAGACIAEAREDYLNR